MDDEEIVHRADGLFYRLLCGNCEATFEVEEDPRSGTVVCDMCGTEAEVEGDY